MKCRITDISQNFDFQIIREILNSQVCTSVNCKAYKFKLARNFVNINKLKLSFHSTLYISVKDKAEVLMQVDQLTEVKDELTEQVSHTFINLFKPFFLFM